MASQASRKRTIDGTVIPDRLYFKIGDVARICQVETYVLRFWETQFPQLKPNKSGTGQRLYRRREVELALEIKRLLHGEGYTIAGARQALDSGSRRKPDVAPPPAEARIDAAPAHDIHPDERPADFRSRVARIRTELRDLASMLSNAQPAARRDRPKIVRSRQESDSLFPF